MIKNIGYEKNGNLINPQISEMLDKYSNPASSNIEIKGTIIEKNGKNIRIQNSKTNEILDLVTKTDLSVNTGEILTIKKSQVEMITTVSSKDIEKKKEAQKEEIKELMNKGVKPTDETLEAQEKLKFYAVPATKENIQKYIVLKNDIKYVKNEATVDKLANLMIQDPSIEEMGINDLKEKLSMKSSKEISPKLKEFNKEMENTTTYDQAREIAKKIYKQDMGKDILDSIIALKDNDIEVTKENIDKINDLASKVHDIKDIEPKDIIKAIQKQDTISINNLYKIKNKIEKSQINVSVDSKAYENQQPNEKLTDKEIEEIKDQIIDKLEEMGFDKENFNLAKDILKSGLNLNYQNISTTVNVQNAINEISELLTPEIAAQIMGNLGQNPGDVDMQELLSMIKDIVSQISELDVQDMTKEQKDLGLELIKAIKEMQGKTMIQSKITLKTVASITKDKNTLYNQLFLNKDFEKPLKMLSQQERIAIKTSTILHQLQEINPKVIDVNKTISLNYLAKQHQIIRTEKDSYQDSKNLIATETLEMDFTIATKDDIKSHYEYLRFNITARHVYKMVNDGIDPLETDIRRINKIIHQDMNKGAQTIKEATKLQIDQTTAFLANTQMDYNINTIKTYLNIKQHKNSFPALTSEMEKEAKERKYEEITPIIQKINENIRNLADSNRRQMEKYLEEISNQYKKLEEEINKTQRQDKEIFKEYTKEIRKSLSDTSEIAKEEHMFSMPFNMNQEGGSADVYARTPNSKKGKIDPQNMRVLINLGTKNLGKMGFFIKVKENNISLKISGNQSTVSKAKAQITTLENYLSNLGYNLDTVSMESPEEKSTLEFVRENQNLSTSALDYTI